MAGVLPSNGSGPSPLARGKRRVKRRGEPEQGTIPARAGETPLPSPAAWQLWDHPRSRGGNAWLPRPDLRGWGPSPLARGKRTHASAGGDVWGTIPARAGETAPNDYIELGTRDHPRSRGGNTSEGETLALPQGPSPLARGKRRREHAGRRQHGTIPARAGETRENRHQGFARRDHPRSRGGNCELLRKPCRQTGPSPLARGKPARACCWVTVPGTIPARAGETSSLVVQP